MYVTFRLKMDAEEAAKKKNKSNKRSHDKDESDDEDDEDVLGKLSTAFLIYHIVTFLFFVLETRFFIR
jgi:hypothetical protein